MCHPEPVEDYTAQFRELLVLCMCLVRCPPLYLEDVSIDELGQEEIDELWLLIMHLSLNVTTQGELILSYRDELAYIII